MGYRSCRADKSADGSGRYVTSGTPCFIPSSFKPLAPGEPSDFEIAAIQPDIPLQPQTRQKSPLELFAEQDAASRRPGM